ncbi:phage tail protein (plasmid) [Vibrio campbellii]|uniref:Phage tail protein n=1 Tax=Vibrio campbellii TaxID=680 RepID=A0ABY5ILD7_9VIBR|nr:phage tail protein [Vibrio campbellii]UTZ35021.1 phage tail protein [Vibrio campbellii]UTZ35110.1 phage tail protein [Vibrio campbellii]
MSDPLMEVVESARRLNQVIEEKAGQIDAEVAKAKQDFENRAKKLSIISGFEAINYNGDFLDTVEARNSKGEVNIFPIGMGIGSFRNDCVLAEVIPVFSGEEPETRDPEAQELLKYMGCNVKNFSSSFNILKITITDPATLLESPRYDFFIPEQHLKRSPSATFMAYFKTIGDFSVSHLGNSNGEWTRVVERYTSTNPGSYTHIDLNFSGVLNEGDVLYLALPTICAGLFPEEYKHGNLYNPREKHIRHHHLSTEPLKL